MRREDLFERKTAGRCMQTSPPRPFRADRVTTVEESRSFAAEQLSNPLPSLALRSRSPFSFLLKGMKREVGVARRLQRSGFAAGP